MKNRVKNPSNPTRIPAFKCISIPPGLFRKFNSGMAFPKIFLLQKLYDAITGYHICVGTRKTFTSASGRRNVRKERINRMLIILKATNKEKLVLSLFRMEWRSLFVFGQLINQFALWLDLPVFWKERAHDTTEQSQGTCLKLNIFLIDH